MRFSEEEKRKEKDTIINQIISVIKNEFTLINSESESMG